MFLFKTFEDQKIVSLYVNELRRTLVTARFQFFEAKS